MAVRVTMSSWLLALLLAGSAGCGKMVVVGEVDGGEGANGDADSDTDVDSDTDADTDTDPAECSWHRYQVTEGLNGVWGATAQAVYAVGGDVMSSPIALRYNGASWVELDGLGTYPPGLRDVWGAADDDVWVILHGMRVLRFDGWSWTFTDVVPDAFSGIWGNSPSSVFVVGGGIAYSPLIVWYDQGSWVQMGGAVGDWLNAVWGSSESDIYSVGYEVINRFNGVLWHPVDVGSISLSGVSLEGVWGSASNDVYAVGHHWAGPVLLHFDGTAWQGVNVSSIASGADLRGVHGTGPDDVWAVGGLQSSGIVLRFDGDGWTEVDYPFPFPLNDVWVAPTGEVFTVGDLGAVYCVP